MESKLHSQGSEEKTMLIGINGGAKELEIPVRTTKVTGRDRKMWQRVGLFECKSWLDH